MFGKDVRLRFRTAVFSFSLLQKESDGGEELAVISGLSRK